MEFSVDKSPSNIFALENRVVIETTLCEYEKLVELSQFSTSTSTILSSSNNNNSIQKNYPTHVKIKDFVYKAV